MINQPGKVALYCLVVFCVIVATSTPAVALPSVIAGPIVSPINGHTYYLLSADSWTNSESQAESMGGHLATIRNATENTWAYNTFSVPSDLRVWIGFEDAPPLPLFDFVWADGEPVTYTNWGSGEPNNYEGIEYYAYIIPPDQGTYAAHWNDTSIDGSTVGPVNGLVEVESDLQPCQIIDYSKGFTASGLSLNGGATVTNKLLQLTDGKSFEARSAFYTTKVPVDSFAVDATLQIIDPMADGITFTIQSNSPHSLGQSGGGLGYAGIPNSVALKLDLHNNYGEGTDSTGIYINGAFPSTPSIDLSQAGIDLHSGHVFAVHLTYSNGITEGSIKDTVTGKMGSMAFSGNIPAIVGHDAYVGFTGGTGRLSATQNILSWSFSGGTDCSTQ